MPDASLAVSLEKFFTSMVPPPSSSILSMLSLRAWIWSSESISLPHLQQVDSRSILMSLMNPTWMTGMARSMCPKCPGHSSTLHPQVLQRSPGSMTPMWGSMRPISMG